MLKVGDLYTIHRPDNSLVVVGVVHKVDGEYFEGWEIWAYGPTECSPGLTLNSFSSYGRFMEKDVVALGPRQPNARRGPTGEDSPFPVESGQNRVDSAIRDCMAMVEGRERREEDDRS
jgi:hypothetical protein